MPSDTGATFSVASETFRVQLVGDGRIRTSYSSSRARIPNRRIVSGAGANTGCSWHLEDVEFVERLSSCATVALLT